MEGLPYGTMPKVAAQELDVATEQLLANGHALNELLGVLFWVGDGDNDPDPVLAVMVATPSALRRERPDVFRATGLAALAAWIGGWQADERGLTVVVLASATPWVFTRYLAPVARAEA